MRLYYFPRLKKGKASEIQKGDCAIIPCLLLTSYPTGRWF